MMTTPLQLQKLGFFPFFLRERRAREKEEEKSYDYDTLYLITTY